MARVASKTATPWFATTASDAAILRRLGELTCGNGARRTNRELIAYRRRRHVDKDRRRMVSVGGVIRRLFRPAAK
jgi:hypothetical protein